MNLDEIRELAGIEQLMEVVQIPENASLEDIVGMLDAAKRGLSLANRLTNKNERDKHVRAVFVNLNKIRGALSKHLKPVS